MAEIEVDTSPFNRAIAVYAAGITKPVEAAITVAGKPEDYWFVWEAGSRKNPGPKTVRGAGGRIFSRQAPKGYVLKYRAEFIKWLLQEFKGAGRFPIHADIVKSVNRVAHQALALIKATVPIDSGALRDSMTVKEAQ